MMTDWNQKLLETASLKQAVVNPGKNFVKLMTWQATTPHQRHIQHTANPTAVMKSREKLLSMTSCAYVDGQNQ